MMPLTFRTQQKFALQLTGIVLAALLLFIILVAFAFKKPAQKTDILSEISTITQNIRRHYQKNFNYRGLSTNSALKDSLIPAYMVRNNKIFSRLKTEILIGRDETGSSLLASDTSFAITYLNLDQNKCVSAVANAFDITLGLNAIKILTSDKVFDFSYGGELPLPISKQDAKSYCQAKNTVVFSFE